MILRALRLHPFGCFTDKSVAFAPGLNVVLGPNEAGKSTLFAAVKSSFLRARLAKPQFQSLIARYLPVTGGDVAAVEIELLTPTGAWTLRRRWGASPGSELILPGGGALADEEAISAKLEEALPAKQGTFWWILLTGQAELAETVSTLKNKKASDTLADLSDLLRKAVWEAGGVSVERFLTELREREGRAFLQWDRVRGGPKDGRGIDHPWKSNVGNVLGAYYDRENARAAWKAAAAYEAGLDEVNAHMRAAASALAAKEAFLAENARAALGARERRPLEAERAKVHMEIDRLRQISVEWPVSSHRAREIEGVLARGANARAVLEKELCASKAQENGRLLRERWSRVERLSRKAEEAERGLAGGPAIDAKAIEKIRRASSAVDVLQAGREAGRISLSVTATSAVELVVRADLQGETRRRLAAGETARLDAERSISIVHPDMRIEASTGNASDEPAAKKVEQSCQDLAELLAHSGVSSLAEAERKAAQHAALAAELLAARKSLADELGTETLAEMRARVTALGPEEPVRPSATVSAELATLVAEGEARERELAEVQRRLAEWESTYGSAEALIDQLGDSRRREKDIDAQLGRCAPLPVGYADAAVFLRSMEGAQEELTQLKVEARGLEVQKHDLEEKGGERTAGELAVSLKEAEEALGRALRQGEALERVRKLSETLLTETDSAVFSTLRAEVDGMMGAMTGGRHAQVEMEGSLPLALRGPAGSSVALDLLSAGTKDSLAMALRLAMASHFLAGSDGFMMMDDPLVEMDPDRQAAAAATLASFASRWQLIVFTCHPAAAKLLGGNLIEL
jgi:DNA repair protein SbcC/Rad50